MEAFKPFSTRAALENAAFINKIRGTNRAAETEKSLRNLSAMAYGGDQNALRAVGSIDPGRMNKILDGVSKMSDADRERTKHNIDMTGRLMNDVLSAPPIQQPDIYENAKRRAVELGLPPLPDMYDPSQAQSILMESVQVSDAMTSAQKDIMAGGARRGSEGFQNRLKEASQDKETKFSVKSADEKAIMSFIAPEFAGEINLETGNISFKTTEDAKTARKILTKASRIYSDGGGNITRAEAATKAFEDVTGKASDSGRILEDAKAAIAAGAPKDVVNQRLVEMGFDAL